MRWLPARRDMAAGALIYTVGDTAAALIVDEFGWLRLLGIALVGGLLYAAEVPSYFRLLDRRFGPTDGGSIPPRAALWRTLLAVAFFNPVWIARHMLFIHLFAQEFERIGWDLLRVGTQSFAMALPVGLVANYLIQVRVALRYRFLASATFSALMALWYAISVVWIS